MKKQLLFAFIALFTLTANASDTDGNFRGGEAEEQTPAAGSSTARPESLSSSSESDEDIDPPLRNLFKSLRTDKAMREEREKKEGFNPLLEKNMPKTREEFLTEGPRVTIKHEYDSFMRTVSVVGEENKNFIKITIPLNNGAKLFFFHTCKDCERAKCGGMPALQLRIPSVTDGMSDLRVTAFAKEKIRIGTARVRPNMGVKAIVERLMAAGFMPQETDCESFISEKVQGSVLRKIKCKYSMDIDQLLQKLESFTLRTALIKGAYVDLIESPSMPSAAVDPSDATSQEGVVSVEDGDKAVKSDLKSE